MPSILRATSDLLRRLPAAAARALALAALLGFVLEFALGTPATHHLWVRADAVPGPLLRVLLVGFTLATLVPARHAPALRAPARLATGLLGAACLADAAGYYRLLAVGGIRSSLPLPLSLLLAFLLLVHALRAPAGAPVRRGAARWDLPAGLLRQGVPLTLLGIGTLLHVLAFGATDYARPADAAVVFGAAVRPSGRPSQALRDRTATACELYHRGLVDVLVLSGGRDPQAPRSEPACMASIARGLGVPEGALLLDEGGVDTAASMEGLGRLVRRHGWGRVLAVSHDYHLARIKLLGDRAGLEVATVPARESRPMAKKPWFVVREVAAFAWYLLGRP